MLILRRFGPFFCSLKRVDAGIFMLACALFNEQNKGPPEYYHMICIGKTKCTSEKGLFAEDYAYLTFRLFYVHDLPKRLHAN